MGTRPPRPTQRFKRGRAQRAQMIFFGLTPRCGALTVGGQESSPNHRAALSWSDLDVGSSVPEVAEVPRPSVLSRICARCSRCLELPPVQHRPGRLLLLEYVSTAMAAAHRDAVRAPRHHRITTANSYYWLPHWSRCAPTMPLPHAQPLVP